MKGNKSKKWGVYTSYQTTKINFWKSVNYRKNPCYALWNVQRRIFLTNVSCVIRDSSYGISRLLDVPKKKEVLESLWHSSLWSSDFLVPVQTWNSISMPFRSSTLKTNLKSQVVLIFFSKLVFWCLLIFLYAHICDFSSSGYSCLYTYIYVV